MIQVHLERHLQSLEDFISDSTRGVDHIEAGTLPDFIQDVAECRACPAYGHLCNPPSYETGAQIIADDEVIQMVERFLDIQETGEEWQTLDAAIKEKFRGTDLAIVGRALLEGRWQKDTKYELPPDIKAEIDALKKPWARRVDKGKFFLKVTRI